MIVLSLDYMRKYMEKASLWQSRMPERCGVDILLCPSILMSMRTSITINVSKAVIHLAHFCWVNKNRAKERPQKCGFFCAPAVRANASRDVPPCRTKRFVPRGGMFTGKQLNNWKGVFANVDETLQSLKVAESMHCSLGHQHQDGRAHLPMHNLFL